MKELHNHNIIHRDIKLENILIGNSIDDVRLTDFGWAIAYDPNKPPREKCGTYKYMPPEVIQKKPYDHKVDSWALGFVLFELLGFGMPFNEQSPAQYRKAICEQPVGFERLKVFTIVSPEAKDLIEKLLAKDPKQRLSVEDALNHPWFSVNT